MCPALGLDGGSLPCIPFYHPVFGNSCSAALDIFGLGSVLYVILTGRWPYRDVGGRPKRDGERHAYEMDVEERMRREEYPADAVALPAGNVIMGCWNRRFETAQAVVEALIAGEKCEKHGIGHQ